MNKQNKQKQKNKKFKNSWIRPCREITFFCFRFYICVSLPRVENPAEW